MGGYKDFWGLGVRHIQVLLLFSCTVVNHLLLSGLGAVVIMIESEVIPNSNYTLYEDTFRTIMQTSSNASRTYLVHTIYFTQIIGYVIGGILSVKANPKYTLLFSSVLLSFIPYIIPPITSYYGFSILYFIRFYQGIFYGILWPTLVTIIAKWVPYTELARCMSLIISAPVLGQCIIVILGKFLQTSIGGWSSLFYISGNIGVLWVVAWVFFGYSDPLKCFYISPAEKFYIDKLTHDIHPSHKGISIPWTQIIRCKPYYGCMLESFFATWAYEFAKSPRFFQTYLTKRLEVSENEALYYVNIVPIIFLFEQIIVATIIDLMHNRERYPLIYLRKTCNSIGLWGSSICLFFICYTTKGTTALIFYNLMLFTTAFGNVGCILTHFDLAPNFAGFLFGLTKTVGHVPLVVATIFLNNILTHQMNVKEWCLYYFVAGVSLMVGNFIYTVLANDELQKFNKIVIHDNNRESTITITSAN